jgi:nitrite reductase/ring-hydroxylating ferredoxin subunit
MTYPTARTIATELLILGSMFLLAVSCKKEEQQTAIPYVYVSFSFNPNSTEYQNLNVTGGWETVTGGYNGILIYRKSMDEFVAYERACPYDPLITGAQVKVDNSGLICYCPICNSKYTMTDGIPFEGPSHFILKQYSAMYDGNILYISN